MHQVHVEVGELEVGQRLAAGFDDAGVPIVPDLGDDPDIFAAETGAERFGERLADARFVAVDGGAVDVTIANGECVFDGSGDFPGRGVVGAERAEPDGRHERAGTQAASSESSIVPPVDLGHASFMISAPDLNCATIMNDM